MRLADRVVRTLIPTRMFVKGWGKPEVLMRIIDGRKHLLSNRETAAALVPNDYPVFIDKETREADRVVLDGHFKSPYAEVFPGLLPKVSETARFRVILPKKWREDHPVCLCLGATGDHGYALRSSYLSQPLLKDGIGTILLENPYYGTRKPQDQFRSSLMYVSDLFVLGGALMLESSALLHWCEREGYGPLCIHGTSMGGYMASLSASIWPKPIGLVPCLSWSTASNVYTKGILAKKVKWEVLKAQYYEDRVYAEKVKPAFESGEKHYIPENTDSSDYDGKHQENSSPFLSRDRSPSSPNYSDPAIVEDNEKVRGTVSTTNATLADWALRTFSTPLGLTSVVKQYRGVADFKSKSFSKNPDAVIIEAKELTSRQKSSPLGSTILNQLRQIDDVKAKSFSRKDRVVSISSQEVEKLKKFQQQSLDCEVMDFMRRAMDDMTHLANYSRPIDMSLIVGVVAAEDDYVPRMGVMPLEYLWPDSTIHYLPGGHLWSIITTQKPFRDAIVEAIDRNRKKYYTNK